MSSEKNKRIMIGVIIFLVVMIMVLFAVVFYQKGRLDQSKEQAGTRADAWAESDAGQQEAASQEAVSDSKATQKADDKENDSKADTSKNRASTDGNAYKLTVNPSASWEQDGKYVTQFDIELWNNTSEAVEDWKVTFDNVTGAEVLTGWNGKFEIKKGVLTITPESYNGSVDANNMVSCGVQILFDDQSTAEQLAKGGTLYLGGVKVDSKLLAEGSDDKGSSSDQGDGKSDSSNGRDDKADASAKDATGSSDGTSDSDADSDEKSSADKKAVKAESGTPFANHGALSVKGTDLVDKNGKQYQLKGVSTHGIAWFPDYVNKDAFKTFRDDWGANIVRLAMYTDENNGYCTDGDPEKLKKLVRAGVDAATELGMYVIVDWHILHDLTPLKYEEQAKAFFEEISSEYKNSDNIIYEICNEPNGGTSWADVKKYAEVIIPIIRANDSNAVIVVGTPTWSQDVDAAAKDPIKDYDNVMYALHFYAATHKDDLRNKLTAAKKSGLPIFVTEFSICEASGDGQIDYDSAKAWFDLINDNNLSYCAWNVSNKAEKSSLIKSSVNKTSGWSEDDLSDTGAWIREQMK